MCGVCQLTVAAMLGAPNLDRGARHARARYERLKPSLNTPVNESTGALFEYFKANQSLLDSRRRVCDALHESSSARHMYAICSDSLYVLIQVAIKSRHAEKAAPQLRPVGGMLVALLSMVAALTFRRCPKTKAVYLLLCTSFPLFVAASASETPSFSTATVAPSDGDQLTRTARFGGSRLGDTMAFRDSEGAALCIFTLLRGGTSDYTCALFEQSRKCLREAIPSGIKYEQIAFHEGNLALDVQTRLGSTL